MGLSNSQDDYSSIYHEVDGKRVNHQKVHNIYGASMTKAAGEHFEKTFGRHYGLFESYRMEDAEYATVIMGSSAGTAKAAVDELREAGIKAGLVKIRVFRPFPGEELAEALKGCRAVAVMDKSEGFSGCGGPLFAETAGALINLQDSLRPWRQGLHRGSSEECIRETGEDRA